MNICQILLKTLIHLKIENNFQNLYFHNNNHYILMILKLWDKFWKELEILEMSLVLLFYGLSKQIQIQNFNAMMKILSIKKILGVNVVVHILKIQNILFIKMIMAIYKLDQFKAQQSKQQKQVLNTQVRLDTLVLLMAPRLNFKLFFLELIQKEMY